MSFEKTFERAYLCTKTTELDLPKLKLCKINILQLKDMDIPSDFKYTTELDRYISKSIDRLDAEILFKSNIEYNTSLTTDDVFSGTTALLYRRGSETSAYNILYKKVQGIETGNVSYAMMSSIVQNKIIKDDATSLSWASTNLIFLLFIGFAIFAIKYLFSEVGQYVMLKSYLSHIGDLDEEVQRVSDIIDRLNYEKEYESKMSKKEKKVIQRSEISPRVSSDMKIFTKYRGKIKALYKDKIWKRAANMEKSIENLKNLLKPE